MLLARSNYELALIALITSRIVPTATTKHLACMVRG